MRRLVALLALVALAACADPGSVQQQAVGRADGLQLSGQLAGHRISLSDGAPDVSLQDCDPADGPDTDLCVVARTIDGSTLGLVIENPDAFAEGVSLTVADRRCDDGCDGVDDVAVVEVRLDGRVHRATSGTVSATAWGERYTVEVTLRFADGGGLSGSFDVAEGIRGATP